MSLWNSPEHSSSARASQEGTVPVKSLISFFLQPVLANAAAWIGVRVLMGLPAVIGRALNGGKLVLSR
jgi:hypothetical protein